MPTMYCLGLHALSVHAVWRSLRPGRWRVVLAWLALLGAPHGLLFGPGQASAQTQAQPIEYAGTWVARAQTSAGPASDTVCLVPCGGGADIACQAPDSQGISTFILAEPAAVAARCVQAVARNGAGTSGLSASQATFTARKAGDCNGDGKVTVSDFICVNQQIFAGG